MIFNFFDFKKVINKRIIINIFGLIILLESIVIMLAWYFNIESIQTIMPGHVSMKFNTAALLFVSAVSLLALSNNSTKHLHKIFSIVTSVAAVLFTILTLTEYFNYSDLGIDQIFFKSPDSGRMAITTAYCLLACNLSILLFYFKSFKLQFPIIAALNSVVLVYCIFTFINHFLQVFDQQYLQDPAMAIHTSFALILLAMALNLCAIERFKPVYSLNKIATLMYAFGLTVLCVIAIEGGLNANEDKKYDELATQEQMILRELVQIMRDQSNLKELQRSYLLTGDNTLLSKKDTIKKTLLGDIEQLDELINNNSERQLEVDKLKDLVRQIITWYEYTISEVQKHGIEVAHKLVLDKTEHGLENNLQELLDRMELQHDKMFQENLNYTKMISSRINTLLPLEIVLTLFVLLIGLFTQNNYEFEQNKLNQKLQDAKSLSMIAELAGQLSIQFNELCAVIMANTELLQRILRDDPNALQKTEAILRSARTGATLIRHLQAFSSTADIRPTNILFDATIHEFAAISQQLLGDSISVDFELGASSQSVFVDRAELERIFLGLLQNCKEAMPNGGKVIVKTKLIFLDYTDLKNVSTDLTPGRYIRLLIKDNGVGMSSDTLNEIFKPFFTSKYLKSGIGMGLSMVYGFMKQCGGAIKVESELDHGTTVYLYFPVKTASGKFDE